ncbi:hypothetical protein ACIQJT_41395 [Streptomyces sp. NPDC091972]|uniref:hypothetical protein n=1 Tax=Streptomyces sp. NPDC091972 TaxID=3366007 RepID=UPI0038183B86
MHSMSALAANTTTAPPAIGGWGLAVAAVIVLVLLRKKTTHSTTASTTTGRIRSVVNGVKSTFATIVRIYRAIRAIVRFLGGRELRGGPRSNATFLRAGTPTTVKKAPEVSMSSVAAPPAKVSLLKKPRKPRRQPSPWARRTAAWLRSYSGRGAQALDRAVRTLRWCYRVANRLWRVLRAIYKGLRTAYNVVAPPLVTVFRALRAWHCWPYAARALVRIIGLALLTAWLIPAWTLQAALVAVAAGALLGLLTPRLRPQEPSDDAVYGPRLWVILHNDLHLPADAQREQWLLLPERLSAPDARIALRLPADFRGSTLERESINELVNSRLPGEWVSRWSFTGETSSVVFTHKPPAKPPAPEPEPPAAVDIWDPKVQEILARLSPDEFLLGFGTFGEPVIQKMADEQAHWALSVGSGGGKSAMLQWLAVQMLMKRGTIVAVDPKMVSLTPLLEIEGVHPYVNPEAPYDMRRAILWAADVVKGRNYEKKRGIRTDFEPLYVFLEECNELADLLKEEYTANKESGDPAADPIWRDGTAKILRLGREVNVHIIAVFQDFKDTQFGGVSLVPLFPFKIMGSYREQQWKRIIGNSFPMPPIQKKAGRMVLVTDTGDVTRIQVPYAPWNPDLSKAENQKAAYDRLTAYYRELRATYGYSDEGLYEQPPTPSIEVAPAILRRASRDESARGPIAGSGGTLDQETAGRLSHDGGNVTPLEGSVTGVRDGLRLVPGQGGSGAAQDPTAPPELLSLAEIARRLEDDPSIPKDATMRQHKARRDDFPQGVEVNGKELFTVSQIQAYYAPQEKRA